MDLDHEKAFQKFLSDDPHLTLMIKKRVAKYGAKVVARQRPGGFWESMTWTTFGERIELVSKALLEWGLAEEEMVGIFSQNRVEWCIADLGILGIRGVSVPIYATNSKEEAEYIIDEAEIRILFVNDVDQYAKALEIMKQSKYLKKVIVFDAAVKFERSDTVMSFADFCELGKTSAKGEEASKRLAAAQSDDLATVITPRGQPERRRARC